MGLAERKAKVDRDRELPISRQREVCPSVVHRASGPCWPEHRRTGPHAEIGRVASTLPVQRLSAFAGLGRFRKLLFL